MIEASNGSMRYLEAAIGRFILILQLYPGSKALKVHMSVAKDTFWQTIHSILVWHAQLAKAVAAPAARLQPIKTSNTCNCSPITSYCQKCPTSKVSSSWIKTSSLSKSSSLQELIIEQYCQPMAQSNLSSVVTTTSSSVSVMCMCQHVLARCWWTNVRSVAEKQRQKCIATQAL